MSVTAKLVRLYRVDGLLRGLQSSLRGAERFLKDQAGQIEGIEAKRRAIEGQIRQLSATVADHDGESKRVEARSETLRTQMGDAQTNKEYKAFLTELNTLKAERERSDTAALEGMAKADELRAQLAALEAQRAERGAVRSVAETDRDRRAAEIKDRLAELEAEREHLAGEVPPGALKIYQKLSGERGDTAMAPVEIQDRRRHEFNCASCMMSLPVESVSALLSRGDMTLCVSCGCILYLEEDAAASMQPAQSKR